MNVEDDTVLKITTKLENNCRMIKKGKRDEKHSLYIVAETWYQTVYSILIKQK